jgi:hypothetical protein
MPDSYSVRLLADENGGQDAMVRYPDDGNRSCSLVDDVSQRAILEKNNGVRIGSGGDTA